MIASRGAAEGDAVPLARRELWLDRSAVLSDALDLNAIANVEHWWGWEYGEMVDFDSIRKLIDDDRVGPIGSK